jgi:hypothetical protein
MHALRRHAAPAALVLSVVSLVVASTGLADAARRQVERVVHLDGHGRIPARLLPTVVPRARRAEKLGTLSADALTAGCGPETVDLGSWCLMAAPYPLDPQDTGKNDYFFATQKCVEQGGWLPTAAQLIGAAKRVRLASVLTDSATNASIDELPADGLKDRREMSATLITTAAGSSAAGSEGVSDGARSDPRSGEPDPVPVPANPAPDTLQYVTVYDNGDQGGFAGARPVSAPEQFRCAFGKTQGAASKQGD